MFPTTATPVANALSLIVSDANVRAGLKAYFDQHMTAGNTYFIMDSGKTGDRCLFAIGSMPLNAERELRTGGGFSYKAADGKTVSTNLSKLGIRFTRHNSVEGGVYAYPTLTAETASDARYDVVMGRKASTPPDVKGKAKGDDKAKIVAPAKTVQAAGKP